MDILKRSLAPLTSKAWEEIDEQARISLKSHLSARKFVDVMGPMGWEYSALPIGRLELPADQNKDNVGYGLRVVKPLVETRIPFELDIWELDNVTRGAKDVDLGPLEEACAKIAKFEEQAIYYGFKEGNIEGLIDTAEFSLSLPTEPSEYIGAVSSAVHQLMENAVNGPYALVINPKLWEGVLKHNHGYPLNRHLKEVLDGEIIITPEIKNAMVVSLRGGDFELTLGGDFAVGYEVHTSSKVRLFLTESFVFHIIEPKAVVKIG